MRFSSAIFLVFLLAQYSFATKNDVVKLLEKTSESKQIFDTLLLEVASQGKNFDSKKFLNKLDTICNDAKKNLGATGKELKSQNAACKLDLPNLQKVGGTLSQRAAYIAKLKDQVEGRTKRARLNLARANEEHAHFKLFKSWAKANQNAWKSYNDFSTKNLKRTLGWLQTIRSDLTHATQKGSFIELPASYVSNLSQIRTEFETTYDNLGGLRPILASVFELIEDKKNVSKEDFKRKAISIVDNINDRVNDFLNNLAEENEHQRSLYDTLEKLFGDRLSNVERQIDSYEKFITHTTKKAAFLRVALNGAKALHKRANGVIDDRTTECRNIRTNLHNELSSIRKTLSACVDVRGLATEDYGSLHGAFMEKLSESNF